MKNIVVAGGAGYVGSVLCPKLIEKYNLTILDTFWFWDSENHFLEKTGLIKNKSRLNLIKVDIRDIISKKIFRNIDCLINLACLSNDPTSDLDYNFTHDVSYNGVLNLFDTAMKNRVPKIIQTSTTSVYGIKQGKLVDENEPPEPITQYSIIKKEIDNYLTYQMNYQDKNITILRPATLYGFSPRLRLDVMINTFLHRIIREGSLMIQGGSQYRPCLHVEDLCEAYIQSIENPRSRSQIYNVTNENYTVNEIVNLIKKIVPEIHVHYQHVIDSRSYQTSSEKIKNDLGIKFSFNLKKGIKKLYNNMLDHSYDHVRGININVIKKVLKDHSNENGNFSR